MANASKEELADSKEVRLLAKSLEKSGIQVRREKLARGSEFRARSGKCEAFGEGLLFVDSSLPVGHQLSVLLDYVLENRISIEKDVLQSLRPKSRALLAR